MHCVYTLSPTGEDLENISTCWEEQHDDEPTHQGSYVGMWAHFHRGCHLVDIFMTDPVKLVVEFDESMNAAYRVLCKTDMTFFVVQLLYIFALVFSGGVLAFKTRNMKEDFGESKQLIVVMYLIALVGIILVSLKSLITSHHEVLIILSISISGLSMFSTGVFVLPRLLKVKQRSREGKSEQRVVISGLHQTYDSSKRDQDLQEEMKHSRKKIMQSCKHLYYNLIPTD